MLMTIEIDKGLIRSNGVAYAITSIIKVTSSGPIVKKNQSKTIVFWFGILAIFASIGNKDADFAGRATLFTIGLFMVHFSRRLDSTSILGPGEIKINTASGDYKIFESRNEAEILQIKSKIEDAIRNSI